MVPTDKQGGCSYFLGHSQQAETHTPQFMKNLENSGPTSSEMDTRGKTQKRPVE